MKIALCMEYPIRQHGGTEVLVRELIRGLAPRHQLVLVSADTSEEFSNNDLSSSVHQHVPWSAGDFTAGAVQSLGNRLAGVRPDLVHFHQGENHAWKSFRPWKSPVAAVARKGVPVITTNHGAFSILSGCCPSSWPRPIQWLTLPPAWLGKQVTLSHCRAEVAVSQHDYHALRRWYPLAAGKFRWIYHSQLYGAPPPFNPARRNVVLCAGTIGLRKGQTYLVEAYGRIASKYPDWQLVLVGRQGDELMMRRIRELITHHRLEKQVQLPGPCSDEELREWYQQAAIFCIPSIYEGLGLSLQEAQFHGCAAVGTRCGGVADLIQDGDNGLLVPARDPAALAVALEKLMSDAALRERFSRRAPQSVLEKNMTAAGMVAAYEKLYAEVLNS